MFKNISVYSRCNLTNLDNSQRKFSINVWAGLINNQVIGPYVFPERLNADIYCNFLTNTLPGLLAEKLTPEEIASVIYQHDNAPAHTAQETQRVLNEIFDG